MNDTNDKLSLYQMIVDCKHHSALNLLEVYNNMLLILDEESAEALSVVFNVERYSSVSEAIIDLLDNEALFQNEENVYVGIDKLFYELTDAMEYIIKWLNDQITIIDEETYFSLIKSKFIGKNIIFNSFLYENHGDDQKQVLDMCINASINDDSDQIFSSLIGHIPTDKGGLLRMYKLLSKYDKPLANPSIKEWLDDWYQKEGLTLENEIKEHQEKEKRDTKAINEMSKATLSRVKRDLEEKEEEGEGEEEEEEEEEERTTNKGNDRCVDINEAIGTINASLERLKNLGKRLGN